MRAARAAAVADARPSSVDNVPVARPLAIEPAPTPSNAAVVAYSAAAAFGGDGTTTIERTAPSSTTDNADLALVRYKTVQGKPIPPQRGKKQAKAPPPPRISEHVEVRRRLSLLERVVAKPDVARRLAQLLHALPHLGQVADGCVRYRLASVRPQTWDVLHLALVSKGLHRAFAPLLFERVAIARAEILSTIRAAASVGRVGALKLGGTVGLAEAARFLQHFSAKSHVHVLDCAALPAGDPVPPVRLVRAILALDGLATLALTSRLVDKDARRQLTVSLVRHLPALASLEHLRLERFVFDGDVIAGRVQLRSLRLEDTEGAVAAFIAGFADTLALLEVRHADDPELVGAVVGRRWPALRELVLDAPGADASALLEAVVRGERWPMLRAAAVAAPRTTSRRRLALDAVCRERGIEWEWLQSWP